MKTQGFWFGDLLGGRGGRRPATIAAADPDADAKNSYILGAAATASMAIGVVVSLVLFAPKIDDLARYGVVTLAILIFMLGLTYASRFGGADASTRFTFVDLIFFASQGLAWSTAWPGLAKGLGIEDGLFADEPVDEALATLAGSTSEAIAMVLGAVPL